MSGDTAVAVRSWCVGPYTVTMTIPRPRPGRAINALVEWEPSEPSKLSPDEWSEYRAGRNHALALLAAELGIDVAVLDL